MTSPQQEAAYRRAIASQAEPEPPVKAAMRLDASYWEGIRALLAGPWLGVFAKAVEVHTGGRYTAVRR